MKLLIKQPIKIGNISINNRLVMPPMETRKATPDGYVTAVSYTHLTLPTTERV